MVVGKYPFILPFIVCINNYKVSWYYQIPFYITTTYALRNIETIYDKQVKKAISQKSSKERTRARKIVFLVNVVTLCTTVYLFSFNDYNNEKVK